MKQVPINTRNNPDGRANTIIGRGTEYGSMALEGTVVDRTSLDLVGIDVELSELSAAVNVAVEVGSRSSSGSGVGVAGKVIDVPSQPSHRRWNSPRLYPRTEVNA